MRNIGIGYFHKALQKGTHETVLYDVKTRAETSYIYNALSNSQIKSGKKNQNF